MKNNMETERWIMERRNAWKNYDNGELDALERFSAEYCAFLDAGKTERECV